LGPSTTRNVAFPEAELVTVEGLAGEVSGRAKAFVAAFLAQPSAE